MNPHPLADDALEILKAIGFPLEGRSPRMQRRLAHILLAVANLPADGRWSDAAIDGDGGQWAPRSREIVAFINEHCGESLSPGSYDDIRRKNLDYLVEASVVFNSAAKPGAATNDGTRGYAVSPDAQTLLQGFGKPTWSAAAAEFKRRHGSLSSDFRRERKMPRTPVKLPDGATLDLKDIPHNRLQKAVVEEFLSRFARNARVLYLGDSNAKALHLEAEALDNLRFFKMENQRLPDVIAYEAERNWLFLIEAVHSANPMSDLRHRILEEAAASCTAGLVFVSAFADRASFAKWAGEVSWETEAWVADHPDHMIHFNGDRFLGPHEKPA